MHIPWFGRQRKEKCPDGSSVWVYKNPDHAAPLYLSTTGTQIAAGGGLPVYGSAQASVEREEKFEQALVAINQTNSSLQLKFKQAYTTYSLSPCTLLHWFIKRVEQLQDEEQAFAEARLVASETIALAEISGNEQSIANLIPQLIKLVGLKSTDLDLSEFEVAQNNVNKWRG